MELSHQRELINDVYPILKLLLRFHQENIQKDYSIQNILKKKIVQAFKDMIFKSLDEYDTLYYNSKLLLSNAEKDEENGSSNDKEDKDVRPTESPPETALLKLKPIEITSNRLETKKLLLQSYNKSKN